MLVYIICFHFKFFNSCQVRPLLLRAGFTAKDLKDPLGLLFLCWDTTEAKCYRPVIVKTFNKKMIGVAISATQMRAGERKRSPLLKH
jgi:hypothetical protein